MLSSALLSLLAVAPLALAAPTVAPAVFTVSSDVGNKTSPYQYGVIFEDINHSGDGGLYAELIMNRAFQSPNQNISAASIAPWTSPSGANLSLANSGVTLSSALKTYLHVPASAGTVSIANPGYWGIDVSPVTYKGEFYVRGAYSGNFVASLVGLGNVTYASTSIPGTSVDGAWTHFTYTLQPTAAAPNTNNSLVISFDGSKASGGALNFNFISLFPPTYKGTPNGMRIDLAEAIAALSPSFNRFPGGNNMEGNGPLVGSPALPWNLTVGPLIDRPGHEGAWGYFNTDGFGLNEQFQWCKDMDMLPVLAVPDGHYIDGEVVEPQNLQPWIQSAIDEIHYFIDPVTTAAGAKRASDGYPDPWPLHYVEIGNEDNLFNGTASYLEYRWQAFYDALHAEFPDMKLIASTQYITPPAGELNDYHVYSTPDGMVDQYNYFDQNSTDTMTMIGEYAVVDPNPEVDWSSPLYPHPFWAGSVAEAVFLIGAERNAGKIFGAAFAPILANVNAENWLNNLIYYNANWAMDVLSTSWHVLNLIANIRMTETHPVVSTAPTGPLYWVAGENTDSGSYIFKAATYNTTANMTTFNVPVTVSFPNTRPGASANLTVLTAPDPYSFNWFGKPNVVDSVTTVLRADWQGRYSFTLPNLAVAVLATQPVVAGGPPGRPWGMPWGGFGGFGGCKSGNGNKGWGGWGGWGQRC